MLKSNDENDDGRRCSRQSAKDVTQVCRHEKHFEAAAMFYRLVQNALSVTLS
jgi:hypothetical protein